ncbi:MAG: S46 family peptidase, partial [bacterium]
MYPISEIHKLNLRAKGMLLDPIDIFNPNGISLIDGICNVGGASGSFVSYDGLILTNHHVAYRGIQGASTKEHDYLQNGFLAKSRKEEVEAKGYTVRITESYKDVSAEVLSVVSDKMDLAQRTKAVEQKIKEIVVQAEKQHPGKRADVSEMFIGKTYVLFIYTYLRDIRLVYAPPRSIGNFGGEVDNWMWPRHTGDFSFLRAYIAPDGSPADYSPANVPYRPKKCLKVAPEGVDEEDFVFILGYPGRTYRHRTSHYLAYEEEVRMPYVVQLYEWQIGVMEKMGELDRAVALKHSSRIKGLANTMKNYKGKLKGLNRIRLVDQKREEEERLQRFIEADPQRKKAYGSLLQELGKVYEEIRNTSDRDLILNYLNRSSVLLVLGYTVYEATLERAKSDLQRESAYMDRNFQRTKQSRMRSLDDYYEPTDKILLKEMLLRAARLPEAQQIPAVKKIIAGRNPEPAIDEFIRNAFAVSNLKDKDAFADALTKSVKDVKKMTDPFIQLAADLYPTYQELREKDRARRGALDKLYAQFVDVKQAFLGTDFIPDANGTLRLTFGHIRGYTPADAVYNNSITTVEGVVEKTTGEEPFNTPQKLLDLVKAKDFGRFKHPRLGSVPTAILYNMDTTGGNSGSPVLNARGEFVGINFDRAFEATINDFAWNESYSRSIAVDIRYVLWVTQKFGGAE